MNCVLLSGRLVRDPVIIEKEKYKYGKFTLAVKDYSGSVTYANCSVANRQADITQNYLKKGMLINAQGHLKLRNFEKNGIKMYVTEVSVDSIEFIGNMKKIESEDEIENADDTPFM